MSDRPLHPRDAEAVEYVLGTLPRDERAAFAGAMARDGDLAAAVRFWEDRLGPLGEGVSPVQPSPALWEAVAARLDRTGGHVVVSLSEASALRRSALFWRRTAAAAASLAAVLAIVLGFDAVRPPPATLVAVVDRSGDLPALLVRVDTAARTIEVRSVAAEEPAGRSLELWSVADGSSPRSLGLGAGTTRIALPADLQAPQAGLVLAVSAEPPGGSATGLPTGPVVYSGRLIADTP